MGLLDTIAGALMGRTVYAGKGQTLGARSVLDPLVEAARTRRGGSLAQQTVTPTRWYLADLESAEQLADLGDLSRAAQLMKAARKDGVYSGLLSTRTSGLVRLPKRFRGDDEIVKRLKLDSFETRSVFDLMFPATELALLVGDGIELGVGIAEMVPVPGRKYPVLMRLDPQHLRYRVEANAWIYVSADGPIEITPGDGRWVLHLPGGRVSPWQNGLWRAIAQAYIRKSHAGLHKDNWEGKLANPARVAISPAGAGEAQSDDWFRRVGSWGINTVFGTSPGYDVKLVESNGRGHQSFAETIRDQNNEMIIAVSGQTVTTDGGSGFANADIHKAIRADLIKASADSLAETINTQGLPAYIIAEFGAESLEPGAVVEWDVTPPKDRNSEAAALEKTAQALTQLTTAFAAHGIKVDAAALAVLHGVPVLMGEAPTVEAASLAQVLDLARMAGVRPTRDTIERLALRLGIELEEVPAGDVEAASLELTPSAQEKIAKVKEGRKAIGLEPMGDERDDMTISELADKAKAEAEGEADVDVVEAEADADEEQTKEVASDDDQAD